MHNKCNLLKKLVMGIVITMVAIFLAIFAMAPGFFLMFVPSVGQGIAAFAENHGYEFNCYDMHGDFKCRLEKIKPDAWVHLDNVLRCHDDRDCLTNERKLCGMKAMLPDGKPSEGKCVCLKGPVFFGCVPKDQAESYQPKTTQ